MNRFLTVTNVQRLCIVLLGFVTGAFWILATSYDDAFLFVAVGTGMLLICLLPLLFVSEYDWFCPWTAVIVAVIYSGTFPSICMSFGLPNAEFLRDEIFLGQPPRFFIWPSLLLLGSFACFAIGYFVWPQQTSQSQRNLIEIGRVSDPSRLVFICIICGFITAASFGAYFLMNGGLSGGMSTKRVALRTLDVGADDGYRSHGYLRHLAKFANIALLLLAAHWSRYRPAPKSLAAWGQTIVLLGFLAVSIAFPFYASSRAGIMWVVLGLSCTMYYMHRKILTVKTVGLVALMLAIVVFVTAVRNGGLENTRTIGTRLSLLFLNRHAPDVASNAHIISAIPSTLEFQHGKTISAWFLAPIPRELMPNKPMVHTGPIIGQAIYKLGFTGIPSGITADLYWNFHYVGVFLGSFVMGTYLRLLYVLVMRIRLDSVLLAPIYAFAIFPIGFKVASLGVGPGLVMPMVDLVTACFIIWLASVSTMRQQVPDEFLAAPQV